ncbi:MAG: hypothetical protein COV46_06380 [Deltaproteobacteria bacterium CG11_big_fil_rev_8_21_14_0_20_49_13]|nr:MAG: hypothetical protein COV46_06380 [Deltaproteobacteria bacterium CG11_big_fil_rev_8_21_14_0_20_49_13]
MKRFLFVVLAVFAIATLARTAGAVNVGDFPEKGWHKGPYLAATVGMMQVTNDKNSITDEKFDGSIDPAFGLVFGWDIADWIGPMFQIGFATATADVGVPANATATVTYGANTYPIGTFPVQNARQYALDIGIFAKATLPYFTGASWQMQNLKIIPYAKLGGVGHVSYVNAAATANKIGAFGGGPAIGLGCEFLVWKGLFFALDTTESFVIQKSWYKDIATTTGTVNIKLTDGGFKPHFSMAGMFGWHF